MGNAVKIIEAEIEDYGLNTSDSSPFLTVNPLNPEIMDAFSPFPPDWTENAVHAYNFCCPYCGAKAKEAQAVWINRRAPVLGEDSRRKWQEFYHCQCDRVWWAWNSDRPAENK
ncbi:hypothetical protein C789_4323 [Microcystis aeruginosa FACHB-905 = DIANCHI905]|uniref:Uncharacterized protein n=2 Tax=Microcystis aeruginosa (strain PCC 7806) TaxID=267872 RepID=A0AB33C615_MICA7|nr:hypothetical protein BH695_4288 [Microcystis aeruginosa PCC 7806SL]ELS45868.1 hypothetical protein C789_4323 [Microcystis aeruginosa FACHB-905 = DIANCHI905]